MGHGLDRAVGGEADFDQLAFLDRPIARAVLVELYEDARSLIRFDDDHLVRQYEDDTFDHLDTGVGSRRRRIGAEAVDGERTDAEECDNHENSTVAYGAMHVQKPAGLQVQETSRGPGAW